MGKFMVWAVCKPDGTDVAYLSWSGQGQYKAQKMAEGLSRLDRTQAGAFFVQQRKVERNAPLVGTEVA